MSFAITISVLLYLDMVERIRREYQASWIVITSRVSYLLKTTILDDS